MWPARRPVDRARGNDPRRPGSRIAGSLVAVLLLLSLAAACDDAADPDPPAADAVLTVSAALGQPPGVTLTVRGALFISGERGETARLCEAIAESYPPQCGGARLELFGLDPADVPALQRVGAVAWSDQPFEATGIRTADGLRLSADPAAP